MFFFNIHTISFPILTYFKPRKGFLAYLGTMQRGFAVEVVQPFWDVVDNCPVFNKYVAFLWRWPCVLGPTSICGSGSGFFATNARMIV